jgi:hypothetical protein
MFETALLIAQLQNPCQGLYVPPNTMARVCQKTTTLNSKNQPVYKMITTANPNQQIVVNRCTWQASPLAGYYKYVPESKWCTKD